MTSPIWSSLINLKNHFIDVFERSGEQVFEDNMERFNQQGWVNVVYASDDFRRAHVDVVDAREQKGLWMMHVCIFPHLHNDGPIYGFDVIAGKNKMTGAFHDFSPSSNLNHRMIDDFRDISESLQWKRERELPDWAKAIFTDHMIAAGNIRDHSEIDQLTTTVQETLDHYINNIGSSNACGDPTVVAKAHNKYAYYQKQNPHTPKTMTSLGLKQQDVEDFIELCLFPEVTG